MYWRRRFIALIIGLAILAVAGWLGAGALRGSVPAAPTAATKPASGAPSGAALSSTPARGIRSAAVAGEKQGGYASTAGRPGWRSCPAGDVVLSLFSSRDSYSLQQAPEFDVDAVSTATRSCAFNIGTGHMALQIFAGPTRVWTSADCAEGQASLIIKLSRGVPAVVPIAWDGRISAPGCPLASVPAAAGTYTATASDGSEPSNTLSFRMR